MRWRGAVLVAAVAALLVPVAGTSAAWTDEAAVTSPDALAAATVPAPALSCSDAGLGVAVSWTAGVLARPGMPSVTYTARVIETGLALPVADGSPSVSVLVGLLGAVLAGDTRTIEVTASAQLGDTTWSATATQQVRVVLVGLDLGVRCA